MKVTDRLYNQICQKDMFTNLEARVCALQANTDFFTHLDFSTVLIMAPTTPPLNDWNHKKGFEISTKHKEAMRQLHWFGKIPICVL
jgi:hypothetical protein